MLGSAAVRAAAWWWTKKFNRPRTTTPAPPVSSNETGNGVTLTWQFQPDAYFFELSRTDDVPITDASVWVDRYEGSDQVTFDDDGLLVATPYGYRLRVFGAGGWSDYSTVLIITLDTANPPATPAAPTITDTTVNSISTAWVAVPTATNYSLRRSLDQSTWTTIVNHVNVLSKIDAITGGPFFYQVQASNADGDSAWSPSSAPASTDVSAPPPTPTTAPSVVGTPGANSINLSLAPVSTATELEIQQALGPVGGGGSFSTIATIPTNGTAQTYLALGLNPSTTYRFRYRGLNSASTGAEAFSPVLQTTTGQVGSTNVQPISMLWFRQNNGVATHPNFNTAAKVWKVENAPEYIALIAAGGWGYIRGAYPTAAVAAVYNTELAKHKLKWICGIVGEASGGGVTPPTNDTVAQTRATVRAIRENPAAVAVIAGIEGINEPNDNRGSGTTVSNWAQITVDHQKAIFQEAKWKLTSVGGPIGGPPGSPTEGTVLNPLRNAIIWSPSLHDIACENSYGSNPPNDTGPRHWHQLVDAGILQWQQGEGMHSYSGAGIPLRNTRNRNLLESNNGGDPTQPLNNGESGNVTGRLELMRTANGQGYPAMTTEWGYHNAVAQLGGHEPITEKGSGIYYPRGCIQLPTTPYRIGGVGLTNNIACTGFEFLDDQDDGAKDSQELNFGIYGYNAGTDALNPNNWRPKPQYTKTKALLTRGGMEPLDAPAYVPARVFVKVETTAANDHLEWQVFANAAGEAFVAIYRTDRCFDRGNATSTGTDITVPTIPVTITDRVGPQPIQVGADVTYVDLR